MGKRARATARKPREPVSGDTVRDIFAEDAIGSAGNPGGGDSENTASGSIIDPAIVGKRDDSGDGGSDTGNRDRTGEDRPKRKYTRRAATKSADAISLDIGSFKDILYSTHAMIASIFNAPNVELDEDEAAKMAKAIANVTRHYDVPGMSQKTVDWIMCMQAAGAVYGPRMLAWRMDRVARMTKPAPQNPSAPANIAPAANAPGARPMQRMETEARVPVSPVPAPRQPNSVPAGPSRIQPGLDQLDGAGLPLKLN